MTSIGLPSSSEISRTIQELREEGNLAKAAKHMSPSGKKFTANVEKLLNDIQVAIEEKAPDSELQKVFEYGSDIAGATSAEGLGEPIGAAANAAGETARRAARLAAMLVQIPEFRQDLWDLVQICQELFDYDTEKYGDVTKARPYEASSETVSKVSEQATESLARGQGLATTAKQTIDVVSGQIEKEVPGAIIKEAGNVVQQAAEAVKDGEPVYKTFQHISKEKMRQMQEAFENIEITDEQQQKIMLKLQQTIEHVRSNPQVRRAFEYLGASYKDFLRYTQIALQQAKERAEATSEFASQERPAPLESKDTADLGKSRAQLLMENAKKLIENFAGGRSIDPFLMKLGIVVQKILSDSTFAGYINEILNQLRQPLEAAESKLEKTGKEVEAAKAAAEAVQGRELSSQKKSAGKVAPKQEPERLDKKLIELVEKIRIYVLDHYQDEIQGALFEGAAIMRAISEDDTMAALGFDVSALSRELFYDQATGRPKINVELWPDIVSILPILAEKLAYLPIPRIENNDAEAHFIFDHIFLKCSGIVPDHIKITTEVIMENTGSELLPASRNKAQVTMSGIEASCKDVAWMYRRRHGLIPWSDVGLMDLDITGEGVTIDMKLEADTAQLKSEAGEKSGKHMQVHVTEADVKIRGINVVLRESRHDFVYMMLRPIINRAFREKLEEEIGKWLKGLEFLL